MKKTLLCSVFVTAMITAIGQAKPVSGTAKPATSKPATPLLKTQHDSASYAIGVFVANFYRQQGITNINTALVSRAINDIQNNKQRLINDEQANSAIINYLNKLSREKAKPNIEKGEKFLAENKKRSGVVTTASGLQYEIIKQGTGPKPVVTDTVIVNYIGTFVDGTEFENSYTAGRPIIYVAGNFIKGWQEALLMMPVGSKWKLYVPYQLGYGLNEMPGMPPGSTLVFELELLEIRK